MPAGYDYQALRNLYINSYTFAFGVGQYVPDTAVATYGYIIGVDVVAVPVVPPVPPSYPQIPTYTGTPTDGQTIEWSASRGTWVLGAAGVANEAVLLPNTRKAAATLRANPGGGHDMKILWGGDSTGSGYGAGTPPNLFAASSRLVELLNSRGILPAANGLACPPLSPDTDSRWTVGSGWTNFTSYGFADAATWFAASTPGGTLTYGDSRVNADRFDVYYAALGGFGTLATTATGGSTTNTDTTVGAVKVGKVTSSAASASTSNTVACGGTGTLLVEFVEPWLSTASKCRVANAGRNGAPSSGWIDNTLSISTLAAMSAYQPNLVIIQLGINDEGFSIAPATFAANIATLQTFLTGIGADLMFAPPHAVNDGTMQPVLDAYRALLPNVVTGPIVDMHARIPTYDAFWMFDNYHMNALGQYDVAEAVCDVIASVL